LASTFGYFSTPERNGETYEILDAVKEVLRILIEGVLKKYGTIDNYTLWITLQSRISKEKDETLLTCDEVFCEYLKEVAKVTNPDYFGIVVKFIILFRECLNEYGWSKFSSQQEIKEDSKEEYSKMNNPEFIPEISNELVLSYLPEHTCGVVPAECTNLVINFCEWLINNGYTCTKVTMAKK